MNIHALPLHILVAVAYLFTEVQTSVFSREQIEETRMYNYTILYITRTIFRKLDGIRQRYCSVTKPVHCPTVPTQPNTCILPSDSI